MSDPTAPSSPAGTGATDGSLDDPRALVGTWTLRREIDDRRAGERHRVDGQLEVAEEGPGRLRWSETGLWRRPEGDVAVHRHLRVERDGDEAWWVRFEDGRDFHPWRSGVDVVHPCAPDTYRGRVSGTTRGWEVTWEVSGPAKDHTLRTWLTRPEDRREG